MKLVNKNFLLSGILLGSFVLSGWLIHNSLKSAVASNESTTPDTFMTEVYFTQFNKQGQWQNSFYSPHVSHYQHKNYSHLTEPRMTSQGDDHYQWRISAQTGISEDNGAKIYLKDQVKITRINQATQKETLLTTTAMTAYPKRRYLTTDQPVTITEPGGIINSTGLTADLNTGDISLLANSRGVYQALFTSS